MFKNLVLEQRKEIKKRKKDFLAAYDLREKTEKNNPPTKEIARLVGLLRARRQGEEDLEREKLETRLEKLEIDYIEKKLVILKNDKLSHSKKSDLCTEEKSRFLARCKEEDFRLKCYFDDLNIKYMDYETEVLLGKELDFLYPERILCQK